MGKFSNRYQNTSQEENFVSKRHFLVTKIFVKGVHVCESGKNVYLY